MKITVYLPDDLGAEVRAELGSDTPHIDGRRQPVSRNISAICQQALRDELARVRARGALTAEGFERVETWDSHRQRDVAFEGRSIGTDPVRGNEAYLTPKGSIAVVGEGSDSDDQLLGIYVSFGQFASAGYAADFVADVADSLGERRPVLQLDI
jgi:hypothetical protein